MRFSKLGFSLLVLVALAATASAVPIGVDDLWSSTSAEPPAFFWGASGASDESYDFVSGQYTWLWVTDDFQTGDVFEVYDFGALIGTTSTPAGGAGLGEIGPDAAFANPDYSSGRFFLAPGAHSITFVTNPNPFDGGRGYLQVTTPEPASIGLMALGAIGLAGLVRRRRRSS